ncbi:TetR/AcrR family transcriptional regulator [Acidovorax sp. SUPP2825]|uniref:TetR/AcrR family transcriptional regulator n=1 Tax=Acidovorax sp. SUPP2825 TaxID=2920879 RepID=UPI0023DE491C|nr:TetR/AcrR family transcriptional regulator [Acidovorax sp. SUPP2825]GKS94677.1 TetR family transcriptional regulator [Acidovorax sp. SUPP2825]
MANRPAAPANDPVDSAPTTRSDTRQEQLIDIACRLFAQRGYEGTSLRDIAEEAKITKAALYYHFPNKEALYERIVLESMQALVDSVREAMAGGATPVDKVRLFMQSSADFLDRSRHSWIAGSNAFWSGSAVDPRAMAVYLRDEYEHLLRDSIAQATAAGQFRAVDPAMAGRMLLSMLNHIARWHVPGGRLTTRQVIEQYLDMAFGGLLQ